MSGGFTTMRRDSQQRYDVDAWVNGDNDIEVKVLDHRHHRIVAHFVEVQDWNKALFEGFTFVDAFPDERRKINLGMKDEVMLNFVSSVDRQEPPDSLTSVRYWQFDSDSIAWDTGSVNKIEDNIFNGNIIPLENKLRSSQFRRAMSGLQQKYMDETNAEFQEI